MIVSVCSSLHLLGLLAHVLGCNAYLPGFTFVLWVTPLRCKSTLLVHAVFDLSSEVYQMPYLAIITAVPLFGWVARHRS